MTQHELFCPYSRTGTIARRTQERSLVHPKQTLRGVTLNGPIRFPQHLFSVHDHGQLRSAYLSLRRPDCTSSRLRAEEYDRPVTQSIATPAVFEVDPHRSSAAHTQDRTLVCHLTREPTVLSRVSFRPSHLIFDRFHQPGRAPLAATDTRLAVGQG